MVCVHRGSGFKSRLSTSSYDTGHHVIAEFVGAVARGAINDDLFVRRNRPVFEPSTPEHMEH